MNNLAMVLDELVADAPVKKANWRDVLARSQRIRRPRRLPKRLVLALAIVTLLALAGTAVGVGVSLLTQQERFHASVPDDPGGSAPSSRSPPATTGRLSDGEARPESASTSRSPAIPPSDAASPFAVRSRQPTRPAAGSQRTQ